MPSMFSAILRGINRDDDGKLNILCMNRNERLQAMMAKTGHDFFFMQHPQLPQWNPSICPIPDNCHLLFGQDPNDQIRPDMHFDLIVCLDRTHHYQLFVQLARQLGCPILMAEYSLSSPQMNPYQVEALANQAYNFSVYESEFLANSWGFDSDEPDIEVIQQGIDTEIFNGWRGGDGKVFTVVDHYQQQDQLTGFAMWQELSKNMPMNPRGFSPGLSTPFNHQNELVSAYRNASVFLNTSMWQSCPTSLLEAMAVGCPVVTTATTIIPEIVVDGVNGYISNDEEELRQRIHELLENPEKGGELGKNARDTIVRNFSPTVVADKWNNAFRQVVDQTSCSLKL